jgi:hypothetical protein
MHPQAKQIVWDVAYEVWFFTQAIGSFSCGSRRRQRFQYNLTLESILLHARVIYDFLFKEPCSGRPDVSAADFFDRPEHWKPNARILCPFLTDKNNRERINRALAHLSYDRIQHTGAGWPVGQIGTEIENAWGFFLGQLAEEQRRWFDCASKAQEKDDRDSFLDSVGEQRPASRM